MIVKSNVEESKLTLENMNRQKVIVYDQSKTIENINLAFERVEFSTADLSKMAMELRNEVEKFKVN